MSMHRTAELIGLVAAMLGVIGPTVAVLRAQVPPHGGVLRISRTPRPPLIGLVAALVGVIGPSAAVSRARGPPHGGVLRISRSPRPPLIEDFVAGDPPDSMRPISDF